MDSKIKITLDFEKTLSSNRIYKSTIFMNLLRAEWIRQNSRMEFHPITKCQKSKIVHTHLCATCIRIFTHWYISFLILHTTRIIFTCEHVYLRKWCIIFSVITVGKQSFSCLLLLSYYFRMSKWLVLTNIVIWFICVNLFTFTNYVYYFYISSIKDKRSQSKT